MKYLIFGITFLGLLFTLISVFVFKEVKLIILGCLISSVALLYLALTHKNPQKS